MKIIRKILTVLGITVLLVTLSTASLVCTAQTPQKVLPNSESRLEAVNANSDGIITPYSMFIYRASTSIATPASKQLSIKSETFCFSTVDTLQNIVTIQWYVNNTWSDYTTRTYTKYNSSSFSSADTISVPGGYTYRAVTTHYASKGGTSEQFNSTSNEQYVQ